MVNSGSIPDTHQIVFTGLIKDINTPSIIMKYSDNQSVKFNSAKYGTITCVFDINRFGTWIHIIGASLTMKEAFMLIEQLGYAEIVDVAKKAKTELVSMVKVSTGWLN